eukprot:CAMPEP_0177687312 /NCGR_PEP_ID=MMETSP0447-20121125/34051_1 /TAXON_ID=0 /ORGANISM="Stygamoeba regulata, Strain BSH-02190019" /LENGTH=61 /DNA_ID=CAMNT_0019197525 /DNA_START=95 /DNA_END=276 /DNA_ORIENTATION=+
MAAVRQPAQPQPTCAAWRRHLLALPPVLCHLPSAWQGVQRGPRSAAGGWQAAARNRPGGVG